MIFAASPRPPIAHVRPDDGETHDLGEHLVETAARAESFADAWRAGFFGRVAGQWHDLGKYAADFQAMIAAAGAEAHLEEAAGKRRVDHSTAGALLATERFGPALGRLLAYVVAGHHAGLPDWEGGLQNRLERGAPRLAAARAGDPPDQVLSVEKPTTVPGLENLSLWVRMLASAVCDADFLDTEAFFDRTKAAMRTGPWPGLDDLQRRFELRMTERFGAAPASPVDRLRTEVLDSCRQAAAQPPGLYALTVPTGGGKTLSSLAFALEHARRHGLGRIIYVIPFTSIIEQTAEVFRDMVGDDAVLEHHCALGPEPERAGPRSRLAAENWDAPLVVTTTVQLFESLFGARTSRIRKLHNLAGSVIVLDEAQAVPCAVLRPVTVVLRELVARYRVSVVLCTATQPAWTAIYQGFAPAEIVPDPPRLFAALERVTVALPPPGQRSPWTSVAEAVAGEPRSLVIVNSRPDCRRLHALLPADTIHLSTWQCAAHRRCGTRASRCC